MPSVLVPPRRLERWIANFGERHGGASLAVADGRLGGEAADGSSFSAALPFEAAYAGPAEPAAFADAAAPPATWGVLLVRKGGFAVARMSGEQLVEHKIGRRHVQGRSKAGGQSQQRFARRRDGQARVAYEAAAEHAVRLLRPGPLVTGGDRAAVAEVLADPRLVRLGAGGQTDGGLRVVEPWLAVPDPRRQVLDQALLDARSLLLHVTNA